MNNYITTTLFLPDEYTVSLKIDTNEKTSKLYSYIRKYCIKNKELFFLFDFDNNFINPTEDEFIHNYDITCGIFLKHMIFHIN